ncbi:predicted protein [Uncinocarpus reesii 1704]|uniref:Uncharacterized protein n=1 Tax=Uncinocarpus reesii (strain UAMH 1704) TaxID=336963 RepID=C4JFK6_UNCRE|nr:uncharacterized protein UREG_01020 [Uncinocarpus reesii 1704]EEP76171.1 predicted protein [Uncinocarpus reesii 1704]
MSPILRPPTIGNLGFKGNIIKVPATNLVTRDIVHISIVLTGESDEIEGATDATDNNLLETRNIEWALTNGHPYR